jgi:hypothetical protein
MSFNQYVSLKIDFTFVFLIFLLINNCLIPFVIKIYLFHLLFNPILVSVYCICLLI